MARRKTPKQPVRSVVLAGKRYKLRARPMEHCDGEIDLTARTIDIDPRTKYGVRYVVIHEALHGLFPKASEAKIIQSAYDLERLLDRCGYFKHSRRKG